GGELNQTVAYIGEAERIGPMHDAAAPSRESVAVDPDHVDVARARRDPLVEHARALVDHGKQEPLDDFLLVARAARDAEPRRRRDDQLLGLRVGLWRARAGLVAIEALAGLLAVAAALAQRVGDLGGEPLRLAHAPADVEPGEIAGGERPHGKAELGHRRVDLLRQR